MRSYHWGKLAHWQQERRKWSSKGQSISCYLYHHHSWNIQDNQYWSHQGTIVPWNGHSPQHQSQCCQLSIPGSSLESHYLKIYFDKLLCYIYVYNIYIFCLIHIYIMYTTFIMLIALNITIITFLAFLKLLNKKTPKNRTNMLFGSINIVKIIFFYLRDCDTSLSDCIECIHPVWLWLTY